MTDYECYLSDIFSRICKPYFPRVSSPIILKRNILFRQEHEGTDIANETYFFNKFDSGLRYDLTAYFIHSESQLRYEVGYVFRHNPIKKGRKRAFIQADFDIEYTAENLTLLSNLLAQFFKKIEVDYSIHYSYFKEIQQICSPPLLKLLDNAKKLGRDKFLIAANKICRWTEYEQSLQLIKNKWVSIAHPEWIPDYEIVRGLNIYTSFVYEIFYASNPLAIGGGGTYFKNKKQYIGVSIGITRLADFIEQVFQKKRKFIYFFDPELYYTSFFFSYYPWITILLRKNVKKDLRKLGKKRNILFIDQNSFFTDRYRHICENITRYVSYRDIVKEYSY